MSSKNEKTEVVEVETEESNLVDYDNIGGKFGNAVNAMIAQLVKDDFMSDQLGEAKKEIESSVNGIMKAIKAESHPVKMIELIEDLKIEQGKLDNVHVSAIRNYFNDTVYPFTGKTTRKMGNVDGWKEYPMAVYNSQCGTERRTEFGPSSVIFVHNDILSAEEWQEVNVDGFDPASTEITNNVHVFLENANNKTLKYYKSLGTCDKPGAALTTFRKSVYNNNGNHGLHQTGYEDKSKVIADSWVIKQLTGKK